MSPGNGFHIRAAQVVDAAAIAGIYNHFVQTTVVTFEEEPVSNDAMASRIAEVQAASLPWLVAEGEEGVAGYAYANRWKPRSAYRNSVETTIYLAPGCEGRGMGTKLYSDLLSRLRATGRNAAIGGTALPNPASIALHGKLGFEYVGTFKQVGFKHGRWVDVAYWQILLGGEAQR
jgi:phosphinothricin acetyltransferase